jgi:hypothetical protein
MQYQPEKESPFYHPVIYTISAKSVVLSLSSFSRLEACAT